MLSVAIWLNACGTSVDLKPDDKTVPMPSSDGGAVKCSNLPTHVALLPDARVVVCNKGSAIAGRTSGTIIYTTARPIAAVFEFYRENAKKAGLTPGQTSPSSFSAQSGEKRSILAMVAAEGNRTKVTINWGVEGLAPP